jgi:predicted Zn-dependent protease
MARGPFNTRFATRLGLGLLALGLMVWAAHAVQMRRHAAGQLALADRAEAEGDVEGQIAALSRYLELAPWDTATRARYGLVLARQANNPRSRARALQVLHQVLLRDPKQTDARAKAAELAAALGEATEALRLLAPALAERPDDAALHVQNAHLLLEAGQDIQAAAALQRALELEPKRMAEWLLLAELLHVKLRQPRQAAQALEAMVREAANRPEALLSRGRFRAAHGQGAAAAEDFQQAIQLEGENATYRQAWADLSVERGDLSTAAAQYRKAAELAPTLPEAYLGLAWCLRELGQPKEAIAALEAGLKALPAHPALLVALAEALCALGRFEEASRLRQLLPADVKGAGLYLDGLVHLGRKEWLSAARALLDALKTNMLPPPLASKALLALCQAYAALEAPEERLNAARHAQHLADTTPARIERASAALAVGLAEEALWQMRGVVSRPRVPDSAWLLYARAAIEHALSLPPWQRSWRETEAALARAPHSDAAAAAVLRARMQEAQGLPADARETLKAEIQRDPSQPEVWLALAALEARQGEERASEELLEKADARFGASLEWLLARASQLSVSGSPRALRELSEVARKVSSLPGPQRDRLDWHLIGLHSRAGRWSLLEQAIEPLLERHPRDPRLHLLLAEARIQAGDDQGARERIDKMKRLPGAGPYWRVAEAERLIAQGKLTEARPRVDEALMEAPNWPRAWLVLGRLEDQSGNGKDAITAYRKALEAGDWSQEPLHRSLQLLLAAGRHAEADELMERAQRRGVVEASLLRPAAFIALRAGRVERARELARLAVPPGSKSYRDLAWLGRLLDSAGLPAEAERALREAISLAPDAIDPWLALARVQRRDLRPEEANRTLTHMADRVTESRRALAIARGHELMGRFDDAELSYRAFLRDEPREPEAQRRLANLLLRLNRPHDAEPILVDLLAAGTKVLPEERPQIRRQLALAVTAPGRPPNIDLALKLLALNDGSDADRRVSALVQGAVPTQRSAALRDLAALPTAEAAPEEMVRWAQLYDLSGAWDRAREIYLRLAASDPDNPAIPAEIVDGSLRHGRIPEAQAWLGRLEKLAPAYPRVKELRQRLHE